MIRRSTVDIVMWTLSINGPTRFKSILFPHSICMVIILHTPHSFLFFSLTPIFLSFPFPSLPFHSFPFHSEREIKKEYPSLPLLQITNYKEINHLFTCKKRVRKFPVQKGVTCEHNIIMGFEIRSATLLLVLVFAAVNLVEESAGATTYVVGDSKGWTIPSGGAADYASWASGHTFQPGDDLVFNFQTGVHDVAKVDKTSFDSCSASNPTTLATVGPASITLTSAGDQYFICTFGQHCSLGQKLTLKVAGATPPAAATSPPPAAPTTPPPTATTTPPPTSTKPVAPTTSTPPPAAATPKSTPMPVTTPPPTSAASSPKATPSSTPPSSATTSSPPTATATAPTPATPKTSTTSPASSPAMTPSSSSSAATPPSSESTTPTPAPAPTAGGINPGGPEVPATAQSPGGSTGPGGAGALAPGPSDSSHPTGLATKTTATSTVMGLIVAIVGGIAFIGY